VPTYALTLDSVVFLMAISNQLYTTSQIGVQHLGCTPHFAYNG